MIDAVNDILESVDSKALYEMLVEIGDSVDQQIHYILYNQGSY